MFDKVYLFSGLKINNAKCDIVGIGVKKGVKMALCGMDLTDDVIKILGIYFSYNKKIEQEKNFLNHIIKIQNILKLWKLRNLTIEGRIVVFKSLAISKLIDLALVTEIPTTTINFLTKIQMEFIWKGKIPKIRYNTLRNDYKRAGLKNVDIFSKVLSLECSWIKRLLDNLFHQWKVISLYLIRQYLGYSLNGVNIFLHRLLCRQQLHVSLFGITSIFKLEIKAFISIIFRTGI